MLSIAVVILVITIVALATRVAMLERKVTALTTQRNQSGSYLKRSNRTRKTSNSYTRQANYVLTMPTPNRFATAGSQHGPMYSNPAVKRFDA
jgi:hypothetical protein